MRALVTWIALAATLAGGACKQARTPRPAEVLVPAGNFRAQTLCGKWFRRACELSDPPPHGPGRYRVLVWLDAFWADTELVTLADYEACRSARVCQTPSGSPQYPRSDPPDKCYDNFAFVPFADAQAYCRWRGRRLPTPDEFERMARWTDGRLFAAGIQPSQLRSCERRPSPEGIRSLNLADQWAAAGGHPVLMGSPGSTDYLDVASDDFTGAFRCVRSANPAAATTDPGRAIVVPDQSDPWLRGGPL